MPPEQAASALPPVDTATSSEEGQTAAQEPATATEPLGPLHPPQEPDAAAEASSEPAANPNLFELDTHAAEAALARLQETYVPWSRNLHSQEHPSKETPVERIPTALVTDVNRCPWCGAPVDLRKHRIETHQNGTYNVAPEIDCEDCDHLYVVNGSHAHVVAEAIYDAPDTQDSLEDSHAQIC